MNATTTRTFPFRLQVIPPTGMPTHTPYQSREAMQKGIDALVKARTIGQINPLVFEDGAWVKDSQSIRYMAAMTPSGNGHHKAVFKAAAQLFTALAKEAELTDDQRLELAETVEQAFQAGGILNLLDKGQTTPLFDNVPAIMAGREN